jgi:hypoxanthine phosphoribosyltransferase
MKKLNPAQLPFNSKIMIRASDIQENIQVLGQRISTEYSGQEDKLCCVCVLTGAFFFFNDLLRSLSFSPRIDFIKASSYGSNTKSSGFVNIAMSNQLNLNDKHVILVDDIIDTGLTLKWATTDLQSIYPSMLSIKTCVLLNKFAARSVSIEPDYYCFDIANKFVIGYGLDVDEQYRCLPDIYSIE